MKLREALHDVAEASPALDLQADLFDRARRARRRRRVTAALAVLVLSAAAAMATSLPQGTVQPGHSQDGLPSRVVTPPWQSAGIARAPLGSALVVFAGADSTESLLGDSFPLTLVGTGDQYRVYQRPEWTPSQTLGRTFFLSPDGRTLLMPHMVAGDDLRTWLLDLASGTERIIDAGVPLAWSPDGGTAILVHYDGDPTGGSGAAGRIRVVDPFSGRIAWEVRLGGTPMLTDVLLAALSPDGSELAVQQGISLTVYRRGGGVAWQRTLDSGRLAGSAAWTPDGRYLAIMGANGQLARLGADAGQPAPAAGWSGVGRQLPDVPGAEVIGWRGDIPVVLTTDRVMLLTDPAQVLVSTPDGTGELAVATFQLDQPPHQPGPPQAGPILDRPGLLVLIVFAAMSLAILIGAPAAVLRRRRRRSGRSSVAGVR